MLAFIKGKGLGACWPSSRGRVWVHAGLHHTVSVNLILFCSCSILQKKKKKEKKSKGPSMEELRKERLKREKESRAKTEMLLRTAAI
jgi:hypothetical protein